MSDVADASLSKRPVPLQHIRMSSPLQIAQSSKVTDEARRIYSTTVKNARLAKSQVAIPNRFPWHCQIGVSELLGLATERQKLQVRTNGETVIRLLTGTFTAGVYEKLRTQIVEFLGAGGLFKVMVWDKEIAKGTLCNMKGLEVKFSGTREQGDQLNHFMLVDNDAYRFEARHPHYEPSEFTETNPPIPARICFNDPAGGSQLHKFFEDTWTASRDVTAASK